MTAKTALAIFEGCSWFTIARGGATIWYRDYKIRMTVRRKRGEDFEAMLVRCAERALRAKALKIA